MRIMLACALGMSTGMLMEKMKEVAIAEGKDYKIWAVDMSSIDKNEGEFDVLLLGPQVNYLLDDMQKQYGDKVPVLIVKPVDYGRMNGKNVLRDVEKAYTEFNKSNT
ncbi:PTS sugar transporter subunit IIB [Breznakia pachnodae]|uniref:PTS system cellobiose-specific IIB component n=1 Tax=Breznakia pachnodae TaxID=265178 RepID=A0ABU0E4P5_9FIRM|nr:PTS sugar transporter subunit IIB [Breznakia pachnodae]MDQ0361796.1 PTS system cellobiose-specific IIB component [Breznakia pachnodae]